MKFSSFAFVFFLTYATAALAENPQSEAENAAASKHPSNPELTRKADAVSDRAGEVVVEKTPSRPMLLPSAESSGLDSSIKKSDPPGIKARAIIAKPNS